jgi:L-ascorbate metabolism protein UlaG (beta-lactamase superfamily)
MPLNRETSITYLGHSTVLIETPGGKRILIDPWTASNPACPQEWKSTDRLGRIDYLLLTHLHSDHVGDLELVLKANPETVVVAIFEAIGYAQKLGARNVQPMNKGGGIDVDGIRIVMTHAFHSSSNQTSEGEVIYGGEPAGFILKLENGFTLYAAGDTALFGDMSLLKDLYAPDLALLPIGDRFTMGPREAAVAIRLLGVTHVIPIHYATFPLLTGTPAKLLECLNGDTGVEVHALSPGETLS